MNTHNISFKLLCFHFFLFFDVKKTLGCTLSIGLTTRFRELVNAGTKPFIAFTAAVIVNVILGYILSVNVFGHYWSSIVTHWCMKIFNSIQITNTGSGPTCQKCAYFQNDPALIEEQYPGLTTLSSGFASVRHKDGICKYHQLYLSARVCCPQFSESSCEVIEQEL